METTENKQIDEIEKAEILEKSKKRIGDKVADTFIVYEDTYKETFEDYWKGEKND